MSARTLESLLQDQGLTIKDCVKAAKLNHRHVKGITFDTAALMVAEVLTGNPEEVDMLKAAIFKAS